jgi:acid stress-induced BolA-like protein IbaG/YrbA|tara:strand:- start:560 stop:787 length:228 start_codon:yes stop_codon:yes gene_type:complete
MEEIIKKVLNENIDESIISVSGSEAKYTVEIASDMFLGKNTIDRHKIIYALLDEYIKSGEIHALTIKAHTLDEYK